VIRDKGPRPGQDPAGHLRVNVVLPRMATGFPKGGHVRYSPRFDGVSQGVTSGVLAPEEGVFHRGVNIEQGGQPAPGYEMSKEEGVLLPPVNKGVHSARGNGSQPRRINEREG
jgi:hypothetical protein